MKEHCPLLLHEIGLTQPNGCRILLGNVRKRWKAAGLQSVMSSQKELMFPNSTK